MENSRVGNLNLFFKLRLTCSVFVPLGVDGSHECHQGMGGEPRAL